MFGSPPLSEGGYQKKEAYVSEVHDSILEAYRGSDGTVAAVIEKTTEYSLNPTEFLALIRKSYVSPSVRSVLT